MLRKENTAQADSVLSLCGCLAQVDPYAEGKPGEFRCGLGSPPQDPSDGLGPVSPPAVLTAVKQSCPYFLYGIHQLSGSSVSVHPEQA